MVTIGKVQSIQKVPCSNMAMPMWVVIIIVLFIVLILGLTILGVKKYKNKRYDSVHTERMDISKSADLNFVFI